MIIILLHLLVESKFKKVEGFALLFSTIFVIVQIALWVEELEKVGKQKSRFKSRLEAATVRKTNQFPIINPSQGGNPPLAG